MTLIRGLAIAAVLVVAFLTLGPIEVRSLSPMDARWDRALAFLVIGFLVTLSARRRLWLAVLLVFALVLGLELAQRLTLDRHGHLMDALQKMAGAATGIGLALIARWIAKRQVP